MTSQKENLAPAATGNEGKSFAEERSTAFYPTTSVMKDPEVLRRLVGVLQVQVWDSQHNTDGTQEHVILTAGPGVGGPRFVATRAHTWRDHFPGWHVVARVLADGTIRIGGEQ